MKSEESQEYGYVSGRVSATFIEAAIQCGVSETALKSTMLWNSFESCCDRKCLCYWNDLIKLIDCTYEQLSGAEGLRLIGNTMIGILSDSAYRKWVSKMISIKWATKLLGNHSYNFINMEPNCKVYDDHAEMHVKMKHPGDEFSKNFIYLSEGIIESMPTMLGYNKMKSVVFDIDLTDDNLAPRELIYRAYFPSRRNIFQYTSHLFKTIFIRSHNQKLLGDHTSEINHQATQNREKLNSLYGLIDNIQEAVLIIRGDHVLTQNSALSILSEGNDLTNWQDYFVEPTVILDLLIHHLRSPSNTHCKTLLKRNKTTNIEVIIYVTSAKQVGSSIEAILRIHEATMLGDPNEIMSLAREKERKSIARDIHDSLGQLLTATSFQLATLELTEEDKTRSNKIAQISQMVREITLYSRKFTRQLDLLIDECETIYDVVELIREEFSIIAGIQVRNKMKPQFHLDHPEALRHIGYILQEAMNNAFRHGKASQIVVSSSEDEDTRTLCIIDNGSGMVEVAARVGLGLRSMEHRIKKIGGNMRCFNGDDKGAIIECKFNKDKETES